MPRTITIILPTNPNAPVKYKTPGKLQVVVYSRVIKCTGAGVQIRKNIRRLISCYPEWELDYVTTDYIKSKKPIATRQNLESIIFCIAGKRFDILIIHSNGNLKEAFSTLNLLNLLCENANVKLFLAHNDVLLPYTG